MLNWVFGNKRKRKGGAPARPKKAKGVKPAYEKAREIAASGTIEQRADLAQHEDLEPEILYYFATDKAPEVRREVAENPGTPLQADLILAEDTDEQVRCELARKIGRLIPDLSPKENQRLADMALQILEVLARDEISRVRATIAEEIKSARNVPREMALAMAEDLDQIVSAPILEYSPMLEPADLIRLVENGLRQEALNAVARRENITAPVTDAVVATENDEAIQTLLENPTAEISDESYDVVAERAEQRPALQPPMVDRDDLPMRTILRVASFVSATMMEKLMTRHGQKEEVVDQLRKTVRERIERGDLPSDETNPSERALERVRELQQEGKLDDDAIDDGLDAGDLIFVRQAVAILADITDEQIVNIIKANSGKAMTALAWKAGLKMHTAIRLQTQLGRIRFNKVLNATADGGYPLSQEELTWYLESFFDGGGQADPLRGVRAAR